MNSRLPPDALPDISHWGRDAPVARDAKSATGAARLPRRCVGVGCIHWGCEICGLAQYDLFPLTKRGGFALFLFCLLILRAENARPPSETDVFERTRTQINDIFQQRDHPPPLPAEMRNPFLSPDERPVLPGLVSGATLPGQLLELLAPTIPVRGIVETAGRFGIIVNRKIYYEGDSLLMEHNKSAVEIEIRRITGNTYTFGYGDAEMTLRLAN